MRHSRVQPCHTCSRVQPSYAWFIHNRRHAKPATIARRKHQSLTQLPQHPLAIGAAAGVSLPVPTPPILPRGGRVRWPDTPAAGRAGTPTAHALLENRARRWTYRPDRQRGGAAAPTRGYTSFTATVHFGPRSPSISSPQKGGGQCSGSPTGASSSRLRPAPRHSHWLLAASLSPP